MRILLLIVLGLIAGHAQGQQGSCWEIAPGAALNVCNQSQPFYTCTQNQPCTTPTYGRPAECYGTHPPGFNYWQSQGTGYNLTHGPFRAPTAGTGNSVSANSAACYAWGKCVCVFTNFLPICKKPDLFITTAPTTSNISRWSLMAHETYE